MPATSERTDTLTPEHIVDVARALISEHGLGWFSMRKLAAALDVNPMTVYLRFDSKDALLDAVARAALGDVELPPLPDAPWDDRAVALARAVRAHLLADRNLLALYASTDRLGAAILQAVEQGLSLMEEIGYADADAVRAFRALFWHTVGFTLVHHNVETFPADEADDLQSSLDRVDSTTHPVLSRHVAHFTAVDGDDLFDHTTRLLVAGLRGDAPDPPGAR